MPGLPTWRARPVVSLSFLPGAPCPSEDPIPPGRAGQVPGPSAIHPGGFGLPSAHRPCSTLPRTGRCYLMVSKDGPHRLSPASFASDGGGQIRASCASSGDPLSLSLPSGRNPALDGKSDVMRTLHVGPRLLSGMYLSAQCRPGTEAPLT